MDEPTDRRSAMTTTDGDRSQKLHTIHEPLAQVS